MVHWLFLYTNVWALSAHNSLSFPAWLPKFSPYSAPASFYCNPCPSHAGDICPKPSQSTDCGHSHCSMSQPVSGPMSFCCWQEDSVMGPGPSLAALVLSIDHDTWSWLCPHVCTFQWGHKALLAFPPQKSALFVLLPDCRYRNMLLLVHCLTGMMKALL